MAVFWSPEWSTQLLHTGRGRDLDGSLKSESSDALLSLNTAIYFILSKYYIKLFSGVSLILPDRQWFILRGLFFLCLAVSSLGQGVTSDYFILAFERLLFCSGLIDGPRPVASLATRSPSFVSDFSSLTLDSSHSTGDLRDPSATPVMEKLFPELLSTHRWGDLAMTIFEQS